MDHLIFPKYKFFMSEMISLWSCLYYQAENKSLQQWPLTLVDSQSNVLVLLFFIYGDVSKCRLEFFLYYSNLKRHEIIDLILKVRVEFPCSHSTVWQEKGDPQQSTLRAPSASPSHNTDVNWALILGSLSLTRRITQLSADVVGLYGCSHIVI